MRLHRVLVVLLVLLLAASAGWAYTIYLKDGSQLIARKKYTVDGGVAIIILENGTRTSLPLSEIDVPRTDRENVVDYGGVVVLPNTGRSNVQTPPPRRDDSPTLSDMARGGTTSRLGRDRSRTDARNAPAGVPRTEAGHVDLLRMQRSPFGGVDLTSQITEIARARGVESLSIYQGSQPSRIFLEFSTNSEAAVFRAMAASVQIMSTLAEQRPGEIEALEVFMATDRRQRAGQFLITPERAQELLGRQIDLPQFYLAYVEF